MKHTEFVVRAQFVQNHLLPHTGEHIKRVSTEGMALFYARNLIQHPQRDASFWGEPAGFVRFNTPTIEKEVWEDNAVGGRDLVSSEPITIR